MTDSPAPHTAPAPRTAGALLTIAVALVAANLRMTITSVGPLIDEIGADEAISPALLGLLAALPLIVWGLVSPASHWLSARVGMTNAVSAALVVFAVGTLWRSLPGAQGNLWFGTVLIGAGLAVANVLMPAVIKRDFAARVPLVMGMYTALLGGMGAVGAGVAVPISEMTLTGGDPAGWCIALAAMGLPIPLALAVWVIANRRRDRLGSTPEARTAPTSAGKRIWTDPLAWQVSLYMGTQSAVFYSMSSWFAPYEISHGVAPSAAGTELMAFQLIGIGGSFGLPLCARNLRLRRWLPALLPAFGLLAWIGMPLIPQLMPIWIVVGGLAAGASLTMALTLMATRARTTDHSSALSGMAQSIGYLVAAIGPLVFGVLLGATGNWVAPFALIWGAAAAQFAIGVSVGRPRFVLEH